MIAEIEGMGDGDPNIDPSDSLTIKNGIPMVRNHRSDAYLEERHTATSMEESNSWLKILLGRGKL